MLSPVWPAPGSIPRPVYSSRGKSSELIQRLLGVRNLGVQEVDIVSIVKPITKYAVTVLDPATIRYHLEKAIHIARTGRPGPVWIDIPLDIQSVEVDPYSMCGFEPEPAAFARS